MKPKRGKKLLLFEELVEAMVFSPDTPDDVKVNHIVKLHNQSLQEIVDLLLPYVCHDDDCILAMASAGRPTKDGGYEVKYSGKWYQTRPVDETPKCNCGLNKAVAIIKKKMEQR